MAGLAGIVDRARPAEDSREALGAMMHAIGHRGSGEAQLRFEGPIGLGHAALALEGKGLQPLASPHGHYLLVFDGALANADELRHTYAHEYPFDGRTDAEVLLAALDGPGALPRFSGMFSFFFWDVETQRGLAARDRLGVKPFWCALESGQFRFASEVGALLAARTRPPEIELEALIDWALAPNLVGARSPFKGISALAPGGLLEIDREGVRVSRWSRFKPASRVAREATLLDDAMRTVYVGTNSIAASTAPTGVWLSGGFDSSLIAGAARFSCDELTAFTLKPASPGALAVAEAEELKHELVELPSDSLAVDIEQLAHCDDLVPAFESQRSMMHLASATGRKVQVVLTGHGVEELHFGDPALLDGEAIRSPEALLAHAGAPARLAMLHPELRATRPLEKMKERLLGDWDVPHPAVSLLVERRLARKLHALDVHAARGGIQARVPFAANELIDFAERVAPAIGLKDGIGKWHLRESMAGEVPEEIRWRPHEPMPIDEGAEPVYRAEALRLLSAPESLVSRVLDLAFLLELTRVPRVLTTIERGILFQAISLSHWAKQRGLH